MIGGGAGVYSLYKYNDDRRPALDAWAKRLAQIAEGTSSKVIEMPRRMAQAE